MKEQKVFIAKNIRKILVWAFVGMLFVGNMTTVSAATSKAKKIRWSNVKSNYSMYAKTSKRFKVKITPSKAKRRKLKWTSSNHKVAVVSKKGTVTALKPGTAVITCRVKSQKNKKVICKITVKKKKVTKVKFSFGSSLLQIGKTYVKKPIISPSYAYDKSVSYQSANPKIATVNSSGVVTGKSEGRTVITVISKDGSMKKASYKVHVIGKITKNSTKFIAHRGLSSKAPENTVKAYELAGEAGFWGAETDVRMTKDGKFILMHDDTLKRMCGVNRRPEDMKYKDIRKKRIITGNNYKKYKNLTSATTVASLEEYLKVCKKYNMVPVIEIKMEYSKNGIARNSYMQGVLKDDMRRLYDETKAIMGERPFMFIAFDFKTICQMDEVVGDDPLVTLQHVVKEAKVSNIKSYKARGIELDASYKRNDEQMILHFQESEIPVNLWTVDDKEQVWNFMKEKVDYITTNTKFW